MTTLLGPVPCTVCRVYMTWESDHLWHNPDGAVHECSGEAPIVAPPAPVVDFAGEQILREVAELHMVTVEDITGRSRQWDYVSARREAAYRLWKETNLTLRGIGELLGGRDHSTVNNLLDRRRLVVD